MKSVLRQLWLLILADWINRHQQEVLIIEPADELRCTTGKIACRERLGGMLRYYYRRAA